MRHPILEIDLPIALKSGRFIVLGLLLLVQAPQVNAQVKQDPRLVTVEELMHLDAQAALRLARRHHLDESSSGTRRTSFAEQQPDTEYSKVNPTPVVQAIYGIGKSLTAEVQIGQDVHFLGQQNKRIPDRVGAVLVLERIDPPCVHIKREQQREILCLQQVRP